MLALEPVLLMDLGFNLTQLRSLLLTSRMNVLNPVISAIAFGCLASVTDFNYLVPLPGAEGFIHCSGDIRYAH